ncbi:AMP-binding protein [Streptomyces sp. NPDC006285]|uniref:AMP-binding protein n=1 Tax=Streptomyces sp. NPDC006285 TaxID=3364742 RepID=UPI00368E4639
MLLDLWQHTVRQHPQRPALGRRCQAPLTFAEADQQAGHFAAALQHQGLRPAEAVVVSLPRSHWWLIAILAVWKAGGVLVPCPDPHDSRRLAAAIGVRLFVTADPGGGPPLVQVSAAPPSATGMITAAHAYAMPTSGSTGQPKLAVITHTTAAAVLTGLRAKVPIEAGEHALHTAAFSFSSSIRQLLLPLLSGAQVTVSTGSSRWDPLGLLHEAADLEISHLDLTPSHLEGLTHILRTHPGLPRPNALRRLLVASEILTPHRLTQWQQALAVPHAVFHLYGQTETGGAVCARQLDLPADADREHLPLALPFAPFTAHLHDRGDGLSELLLDGLDEQDMVLIDGRRTVSHCSVDGRSLYRTGDLVTEGPEQSLVFRGRADAEVKILGRRVDTEALEHRLERLPGLRRAVVGVLTHGSRQMLYVAYTQQPEKTLSAEQIVHEMRSWLDPHVPPPRVFLRQALPANPSGKIDRVALREDLQARSVSVPVTDDDPVAALWRRHSSTAADTTGQPCEGDFFSQGGDSLSMLSLLADAASSFGVRIKPAAFQQQPTVDGLRELIGSASPVAARKAAPPTAVCAPAVPPPTALQYGLWISEQLLPAGRPTPYWLPLDVEVDSELDAERLHRALESVIRRFDVLRLAFRPSGESVITRWLPPADAVQVTVLPTPAALESALNPRELGPMDQDRPLIRLGLLKDAARSRVTLRVHHALADRRSLALILRELAADYSHPDRTAATMMSFTSFLHTLARQATLQERQQAAAFWQSYLPPPTPATRPAPTTGGDEYRLEESVAADLVGDRPGATRHGTWLWRFHRALSAQGLPQPDLIGVDLLLPHGSEVIGPCITSAPVHLPAAGPNGPAAATAALAAILPYTAIDLATLIPPQQRPTGEARQPFFRYKLVHQNADYPRLSWDGHESRYTQVPAGIAEHTVTLFVRETPQHTTVQVAARAPVPAAVTQLLLRDLLIPEPA